MKRSLQFLLRLPGRALVWLTAGFLVLLSKIARYVYVSECAALIPFAFGERVRGKFYRRTLAACGDDVLIKFGTILAYPDITLGSHISLGAYNTIGHADIGDYTLTGPGCHFISGTRGHDFSRTDIPIRNQGGVHERVRVGPDVWLGAGTIVLANVSQGCVVGAGSVVTQEIPDWAIAVGSPARVIRYRTEQVAQ